MPPIPLHIDDPIAPQKTQGATSQAPKSNSATGTASNATTTSNEISPYPPARPGAAAVPVPTPYTPKAQPQPTRTHQQSLEQDGPPPPQPGAVPSPPSQHVPMTAASNLPPPPKAGQAIQQPPPVTAMPRQMYMPSPQQNQAPTHSTAAGMAPSTAAQQRSGPTTLNFGSVSAPPLPNAGSNHPPGYQQNIHAQELTPAQRASLDQQERREGILAGVGMGGAEGSGGGGSDNDTTGNMWNAVKGWATAAGTKLAETEEQVWKRINGQ